MARGWGIAALVALCILGTIGFPGKGGILAPLQADSSVRTLTGIVTAAPGGRPLPGATVYSDKELGFTDERGFFRLSSGKDAPLRVEAPGYQPLRVFPKNEQPLILLLFPLERESVSSD